MQNKTSEIEHFNKWARQHGVYDLHPEWGYKRIFEEMSIVTEKKTKKLLDVGCGTGAFSIRLARMGFDVTGIDISPAMIALAKTVSRKEGLKIDWRVGDLVNTPFLNETFDIIFSGGAIHHLPDDLDLCACEFHRLLRREGKIYMFEPYVLSLHSLIFYRLCWWETTKNEKALHPLRVKKLFEKNGFINFRYKKIGSVESASCPYAFPGPLKCFERSLRLLRESTKKYILPSEFFIASCSKRHD